MTNLAKIRLILLVELRYALWTNSKWSMTVDLVRLDLASDLEVKVILQIALKLS